MKSKNKECNRCHKPLEWGYEFCYCEKCLRDTIFNHSLLIKAGTITVDKTYIKNIWTSS
jgi:hypothetical protein